MIARLDEWLCPVCVHMCVCAHAGTHEHKPARAWFGMIGGGLCTGVLCGNVIILCEMNSTPVDEHRVCVCVYTRMCARVGVCSVYKCKGERDGAALVLEKNTADRTP